MSLIRLTPPPVTSTTSPSCPSVCSIDCGSGYDRQCVASAPSKRKAHLFWWQAIPIAAGIAAARIIRHGIAAHTNSAARFWRKDGGCESLRRELQIERNIAANTPAVTTEHIIRIASLISCTSETQAL